MAKFTVVGGPTGLERHNQRMQAYRIRQAFIDGAKNSSQRSGRPAMNGNFMVAPTNATTGSMTYVNNISKNYPVRMRDEIGRAFTSGQETGGNLYGSDLGWAAAEYAQNRMLAMRQPKKKKEDNSTWDSDPKNKAATPGQDNTKAPNATTETTTPANNDAVITRPAASDNAGKDEKPSSKPKPGDVNEAVRKTKDYFNKYDSKAGYGSLTTVTLNPKALDETANRSFKANNKGFDKFAKSDLGIESNGAKIAHSVILSSGVSEEQAITLSSVIDNWDNDNFIASIPSSSISTAISSLTAKLRSGTHTDRDLKLLAALKKRIMKVTGDNEVSNAGSSVANALN